MTPPRFQFTIRGLLWATFWLGAAFAAFCSPTTPIIMLDWAPMKYWVSELIPITVVFCLWVAVGAVMGKQRKVLLIGLIAIATYIALAGIQIARDFWHSQ